MPNSPIISNSPSIPNIRNTPSSSSSLNSLTISNRPNTPNTPSTLNNSAILYQSFGPKRNDTKATKPNSTEITEVHFINLKKENVKMRIDREQLIYDHRRNLLKLLAYGQILSRALGEDLTINSLNWLINKYGVQISEIPPQTLKSAERIALGQELYD